MRFIRNTWYVAAWSHELGEDAPIGRTILGEPVALYRKADGTVVAIEDRCPHRHAPLSMGRIIGDDIKCMYHGLRLGSDGVCKSIPGTDVIPPHTTARVYPAAERSSWIWVWMGDPAAADESAIPSATGLDHPDFAMQAGALDYAANYELINDNLTDLSHLDYTHETTLGRLSGAIWSDDHPVIKPIDDGLLIERWFVGRAAPDGVNVSDTWSSYRYLLPGLFLMEVKMFPTGTAAASDYKAPTGTPFFQRREQQAVTPIDEKTTRYLYASGIQKKDATPEFEEMLFGVVNAAFAEDKAMIEAQQAIWSRTPPDRQKAFLPQDKAPAMFRRLIASRIKAEQAQVE